MSTLAREAPPAPDRRSQFGHLDELLGRPVSMRSMAVLRILIGPVVLLHLRPIVIDAWHGTIYRDHFYEPYASWYPELPRGAYVADHTPADRETRYLEATVTAWYDDDPPHTVVLRSADRDVP